MKSAAILWSLSFAALALPARAQTAECRSFSSVYSVVNIPYEHVTSELRHDFRVVTANLGSLSGVSQTSVVRAAGLAAGIWNEQGGGRPLRYVGESSVTDLPRALVECQPGFTSLIIVDPGAGPDGALAELEPRCVELFDNNTFGRAHAFRVRIYARDELGALINWRAAGATFASTENDLVSTLVHEFGHAFNLTHHSSVDAGEDEAQFSVMGYGDPGTTRRRDLYWRDLRCTRAFARSSAAYRRTLDAGAIGAEQPFLAGGLDVGWAKISAGVTFASADTVVDWSHAAEGPGCTQWARGVPATGARCLEQSNDLRVFTEAVFRDRSPTSSRVFGTDPNEYTASGDPANGGELSVHQVNQRRSSDGFATGSLTRLRECTQMTGFLQCQNASGASLASVVTSAQPLAVAWHDGLRRSVTAWVHQNRLNDRRSHSVRIAVGSVNDDTLPVADELRDASGNPVQSNVGPGLACFARAANGFDCVIAVVRQDDALGVIVVYRFSVARDNGRNRYVVNVDPNSTTLSGLRTGNRIAAWYQQGRFYIGFRSLNGNQPLNVWSSADTINWTGSSLGSAIDAGPSAVSYFTGTNQLLYVR